VVPDGVLRGQKFRLLPFQKDFIRDVYDNPAGTRHAILSIGRKNGKTALAACLVLAHLCGPEAKENSQIESGARSRNQAAKLFKYAKDIVRMSPDLKGRVHVVPSAKMLVGLKLNVEYAALAAEASSAHGGTPILALRDEVGQVKGPTDDFFTAMETSQGAHDAPLLIDISTQAATDGALLSISIDDALTHSDPRIVCHLHSAPENCDLLDKKAWAAANPALKQFRSFDDVAMLAASANRMASKENEFRNLYLNQRVSVFDPFVSRSTWEANGGEVLPFVGPVWGGLDLSQTTDLTAFVLVGKDKDGNWAVRCVFWMPGDLVEERSRKDREPYDLWARKGFLTAPAGKTIDYGWVAEQIVEGVAGLDFQGLAFDRYKMELLRQSLSLRGLSLPGELIDWGQGYVSMSPAVEALEIELLQGHVRHGMHPVLRMCARNAVVKRDEAGNRKLDKAKSTGRIDGMVALAMALGLAKTKAPEVASVYQSRGVLVL
jgi:phage terminase large subunit-like protein